VNSLSDISGYYQIGTWRDTIPLIAGEVKLRFWAPKHVGEAIFGTSFLPLQDKGMIDTYLIINHTEFKSLTNAPTHSPTMTPDGELPLNLVSPS
jgi:hypothetical protein